MAWFLATLILILLTFIPALELRFSIPVGILASKVHLPFFGTVIGFGLPWEYVFLICVLANILLGPLWYWLLNTLILWLRERWSWFARFYQRRLKKAQKRIHRHVERWGWLGLALFIAIPLPGSGVYTGGIVAYTLGMGQRKFLFATILGVLIAATIVTILSLGLGQRIPFQ